MAGQRQPRAQQLLARSLVAVNAILFLFLVVPSPWWDGRLFALTWINSGVILLLRRNAPVQTGDGSGSSREEAVRGRQALLIASVISILTGGILLVWFSLA